MYKLTLDDKELADIINALPDEKTREKLLSKVFPDKENVKKEKNPKNTIGNICKEHCYKSCKEDIKPNPYKPKVEMNKENQLKDVRNPRTNTNGKEYTIADLILDCFRAFEDSRKEFDTSKKPIIRDPLAKEKTEPKDSSEEQDYIGNRPNIKPVRKTTTTINDYEYQNLLRRLNAVERELQAYKQAYRNPNIGDGRYDDWFSGPNDVPKFPIFWW